MKVNVLGRLEIQEDGGPFKPVRGRRNQQLLSLLTLHAGSVLSDDELHDALWPGDLPADPAGSVRTYVSRLRRLLPKGVVLREVDGYLLDLDPSLVDAWRFESLATVGVSRVRDGTAQAAVSALEQAVGLWQGDPWANLSHVPAAETERRRLGELHLQSEEHLGAAFLTAGDSARGVRYLIGLVEAEPLRELRWDLLMRGHYQERNIAAALRAFQAARRSLIEELGVEPSERLSALELTILRGEKLVPLYEARIKPPLPERLTTDRPLPDLLGRDETLNSLGRELKDAFDDGAPLILVTGEAGIGKTSLLDQIPGLLDPSTVILRGACHQAEAAGPLRPIVELLDEHHDDEEPIQPLDRQLRTLLGLDELGDAASAQLLLFDALIRHLAIRAGDETLVIVVDDVHWADSASLKALAHVLRHRGSARIAMVLACRADEVRVDSALDSVLDAAEHSGGVCVHSLEGLDSDAVSTLLERVHGLVEDEVVDRVMELTNGNPFLVRELARCANPADPATLPDGVNRLVNNLVRGLDPASTQVLHDIALCSGPAPLTLLEEVASIAGGEIVASLELLIERGLVAEISATSVPEYAFDHAIYRQVVVADLIAARRVGIHHRLALASDTLEHREGNIWTPRAAFHWHAAGRSGDPVRCYEASIAAAEVAYANTAYADALIIFTRALDARGWIEPNGRDGGWLRLRIAESAHHCGDHEQRRSAAWLALEEAIAEGALEIAARAALVHASTRSVYGTVDVESTSALRRANEALAGSGRPDLEALVAARLAQEIHHMGDFAGGRRLAKSAADTACGLDDAALSVRVAMGLAWTLNHPDHYRERTKVIQGMMADSKRSGDPELEIMAREWRCAALLEAGLTEELDVELELLDELAKLAPVPAQLVQIATLRAARVLMTGDLGRGIELAGKAYKMSLAFEPGMAEHVFRAQMLAPLREQGRMRSALQPIREMVESHPDIAVWRCALGFVLSESGDKAAAAELVLDVVDEGLDRIPRDLTWGQSMSMLCDAAANCELSEVAGVLVDELVPFSGLSLPLWFIVSGAAVDHFLGRLALVTGDIDAAVMYLDGAVDFHRRAGALPMLLRSQLELGRAQRLGGVAAGDGVIDLRDTARQARDAGLVSVTELAEQVTLGSSSTTSTSTHEL